MKKQILSEELKRMYKLAGLINESDVDSDYIKMQIARSHGEEPTAEEMSTIMAAIQKDKERKESSLEEDMLEEDMLEEAIEGGLTFDELPQIIKDYFRRNITMSVAFVKKDGSVRHMAFRRNLKSYERSDKEKTEKQSSVLINNNLMNVYDTNKFIQLKRETGDVAQAAKGSFRNFRLDNVLAFSVGGKIFDFRDQNQIKERFGEEVYASLTPSMISSLKSDEERGSEDVMIQEGQLGRTIAKMLIEEMLKENEEEVAKRVQELLNPHDYITLKAGTLLTINRPPGFIQIPKETEAVYFGVNKFNQVEVAVRKDLGWNTGTVEFGDIRDLFDESGSYGLEDVPPYEGPEDPMDHQVAEVMIKEGQLGKAITKMLIEEMLKEGVGPFASNAPRGPYGVNRYQIGHPDYEKDMEKLKADREEEEKRKQEDLKSYGTPIYDPQTGRGWTPETLTTYVKKKYDVDVPEEVYSKSDPNKPWMAIKNIQDYLADLSKK